MFTRIVFNFIVYIFSFLIWKLTISIDVIFNLAPQYHKSMNSFLELQHILLLSKIQRIKRRNYVFITPTTLITRINVCL